LNIYKKEGFNAKKFNRKIKMSLMIQETSSTVGSFKAPSSSGHINEASDNFGSRY
jgi:hypothetical protein